MASNTSENNATYMWRWMALFHFTHKHKSLFPRVYDFSTEEKQLLILLKFKNKLNKLIKKAII